MQQRILSFQLNPARWIHDSWRDDLASGIPAALLERIWRKPLLTRLLFERFDLSLSAPHEFDAPANRIALLDPGILENGLLRIGACFHAGDLAREVNGARLRTVRDELGKETFEFARRQNPDTPAVPFSDRRHTLRLGWRLLQESLSPGPQFRRRLHLKIPRFLTDAPDDAPVSLPDGHGVIAPPIFRAMVPQCDWLPE